MRKQCKGQRRNTLAGQLAKVRQKNLVVERRDDGGNGLRCGMNLRDGRRALDEYGVNESALLRIRPFVLARRDGLDSYAFVRLQRERFHEACVLA